MTEQRDYRGVPATARKANRRQQLLDAGLELIGTHGMAALTVRGALGTAQLAPRYFYESFASSDALAVAVFEQILAEMTRVSLAAIADRRQDLSTRLHAGLGAAARLLTDDPRKGRVLLVESLASPVLAPLRQRAMATIAQIVAVQARDVLADDGPIDPDILQITARFLVGGYAETVTTLLRDDNPYDRDTVVHRCAELFLSAYAATTSLLSVEHAQRRAHAGGPAGAGQAQGVGGPGTTSGSMSPMVSMLDR